jgi:hypothetical protein
MISSATGPEWITGGSFGPEGGAACTLFCITACLVVWYFFKPVPALSAIVDEAVASQPFKPVTKYAPALTESGDNDQPVS